MHTKNMGVVARLFAKRRKDVDGRVQKARTLIQALLALELPNQRKRFKSIDLVVWDDPKFDSDCGYTAPALRTMIGVEFAEHADYINVHKESHGDLFCGLLNRAVYRQGRRGCDYTMIVSPESADYLTQDNFDQMWRALGKGAKVTGMAISEITDSILEGRIGNSCAIWDNEALMSVGGFDLTAAKPSKENERFHPVMQGRDAGGNPTFYHLAGVEEVIPLARLVLEHGACIAPIMPSDPEMVYTVPDPETQSELYARHVAKIGTKFERQMAHLMSIRVSPDVIKGGVMPEYRHSSISW